MMGKCVAWFAKLNFKGWPRLLQSTEHSEQVDEADPVQYSRKPRSGRLDTDVRVGRLSDAPHVKGGSSSK